MEVKFIKLHLDTYQELDRVREKRETFNNVVGRLLRIHKTLSDISTTLGPFHYLRSPNPPSSDNPLPTYCVICRRPNGTHDAWCPYAVTEKRR